MTGQKFENYVLKLETCVVQIIFEAAVESVYLVTAI